MNPIRLGLPGWFAMLAVGFTALPSSAQTTDTQTVTLNQKADGFHGIWYMNQPSGDEYVYKYSGGLGTYCAKHRPFAIYRPEVNRTFFCYGGARPNNDRRLLHMVSAFDHETGEVLRPTILLDKQTGDAHDNPVLTIDDDGYLWIFSTSHGRARPSYIHRSKKPYDIEAFEQVPATQVIDGQRVPITNFSYMQIWHAPQQGMAAFFTRYGDPAARTVGFMSSPDGVTWGPWQRLAAIDEGHYQISGLGGRRWGTSLNYHPRGKGLNWRTNLYYLETVDQGQTWQNVAGQKLDVPLTEPQNPALVHDYRAEGLNVYLKDLQYDDADRPVLLYITSKGYQSGPGNGPRTWRVARWTGQEWKITEITTSNNNYDFGELWMRTADEWWLTAPTEDGPQAYNPGGEIATWVSQDRGATWQRRAVLTKDSPHNHTYVRRVLGAHPDFVALWADGHGRQPSPSKLYIANAKGQVFELPTQMGQANSMAPRELTE